MKKLILCLMVLIVFSAYSHIAKAGACDTGDDLNEKRKIDGPANIRSEPLSNAKVIASLPNGKEVTIKKHNYFYDNKGKESEWFFIEWTDSGKKQSGWTWRNNIICD